jgi:hypothetical protein
MYFINMYLYIYVYILTIFKRLSTQAMGMKNITKFLTFHVYFRKPFMKIIGRKRRGNYLYKGG